MITHITQLIFEALHLKQIKHEWVRLAQVPNPDSIAEHSLNAAQIGYILARMEWADAYKVATMLIWHDLAETRIGDMHKIGARYLGAYKKQAEHQVLKDQFLWLDFYTDIEQLFIEYDEKTTLEWRIAKDADYLEQSFQAKIYVEQWYALAQNWIDNVGKALKTDSAKQIFAEMIQSNSTDRWFKNDLKKID